MPTSDKMERAIYLDNVSERGGYIKAENEVVEVPFEKTEEEKIESGQEKKATLREKKKLPAQPEKKPETAIHQPVKTTEPIEPKKILNENSREQIR